MPKYKEYYQQMIDLNKDLFTKFKVVHDNFSQQPDKFRSEYNEIGREVQDIIRDWENRLCAHSENSSFGKFSSSLSDKFWDLIRKDYPKIDEIGVY